MNGGTGDESRGRDGRRLSAGELDLLSERAEWQTLLAAWQQGALKIDDLRACCQDFDVDAAFLDFLDRPHVQGGQAPADPGR